MDKNAISNTSRRSDLFDVFLAIGVAAVLFAAWLIGSLRTKSEFEPFLHQVFPMADRFTAAPAGTYAAWAKNETKPLGYIGIGTAEGYGGELEVAVGVSAEGRIVSSMVIAHRETSSFYQRVAEKGLLGGLIGKSAAEDFAVGRDVDGVTGATVTSGALADASRRAVRLVSEKVLSLPVPAEPVPRIQFGWPEIVLILFFLSGLASRWQKFPWEKALRFTTLIAGLVLIGFLLDKPMNLVIINKVIVGSWPTLASNLYWYILLLGFLMFALVAGMNPYCSGFCPFGAAQELLSKFGGGRPPSYRLNLIFRWIQRALTLILVALALMYRNPSAGNYEISGALFGLIGSSFQFGLLGAVIIASLFIQRFWCRGLCPVRPVADSLQWLRRKVVRSKVISEPE
jgi:NosR/NirI family nitrous oxide reductase transcriptional regulator